LEPSHGPPSLILFLTSLHPLSKAKTPFVYKIDENRSMDIFKMVVGIGKFTKELVNQ